MNQDVIYYPKEAVKKAVAKYPTPFFLYEERRLRENCRKFRDAFKKHFPDFWPLFAVKANPNPEILKIIREEGFGFDAASETEAWITDKLFGGESEPLGMFTGNYNPPEELASAKKAGFILNLDDVSQLDFLEEIAPHGGAEILSIRINPGIGKAEIESNVLAGPDAKYGVPFEKAADAYKRARELGVKKFGIHMMTGSNVPTDDQDYFANIVAKLLEVVAEVKEKTGIEIEMLNMGGGFGVPYRPEEKSLDMEVVAASVREAFDKQCAHFSLKEPRLIAEPGRWIAADMGFLVAKVTVIKDSYKKFVGIDASANDMPRPSIYGAYHHLSVVDGGSDLETVSVVGRICENNDQFAKDRELPVMKRGDIVVIHNCGGHAFAMGHNYNGRPRHSEYLLEETAAKAGQDGKIRQIRRAETFEDLYKTCL